MAQVLSRMNIVGFSRGMMEGKPWCRVQVLEHYTEQTNDQFGQRAVDVKGSHGLPDVFRAKGYKLPWEGEVIVDITPTKKGASMSIVAIPDKKA